MTTFTIQDLGNNTTAVFTDQPSKANEEIKQMLAQETPQIIQGATGAQYTLMDTSPKPQPTIHELAQQLTQSFNTLINAILELQAQAKQPVSGDLAEAVGTVLEQADWFDDRLDDKLTELVEEHDFSHDVENAVGSEVENYFSYNFSLEDHVDVYDLMRDAVDDKLEELVQEKLEEILNERLSTATITFN